jgi:hypothetical protein
MWGTVVVHCDVQLKCAIGMCNWDVQLGCAIGMCNWSVQLGCAMCGAICCAIVVQLWCNSVAIPGCLSRDVLKF